MPHNEKNKNQQALAAGPSWIPPSSPSVKVRVICALLVFLLLLTVYLFTIIPTAVAEDSGELIAAAHVLGIPHPTGYPLWTLLGRGFDLLPVGHTSAYRVALLSAVSAAAGGALLCWLVISLTGITLAGAFAGLSFGLFFPNWGQAVLAEVYALEGLLIVISLVALWRWERERAAQQLYWFALSVGFASMHHRTGFLALGPALVMAFWLTQPRRVKTWAWAAVASVAPFLTYLYLPLRAVAQPAMNWGNPDSLDRFLHHVSARQYSKYAFSNSLEVAGQQTWQLLRDSLAGPGWWSLGLAAVSVPLVIWGLLVWYRRRPAVIASLLVGGVLLSIWVVFYGATGGADVWLIPVGAVAALLGGMGFALLSQRTWGRLPAAAAGLAICLLLGFANWPRVDQSNVWVHRDRLAATLQQMDKNAIFIAEFDAPMFLTYYLFYVEEMRKDVTLIRPQGVWDPWYLNEIKDPELKEACREALKQVCLEIPDAGLDINQAQAGALFAHLLARHYRGRRSVYTLHGPNLEGLPRPPYFLGLNNSLVKLTYDLPEFLLHREPPTKPLAVFPNRSKLISFTLDRAEARAGELVGFRVLWQLDAPLSESAFALQLVPPGFSDATGLTVSQAEWHHLRMKILVEQQFTPIYGLWGLVPSPPGTVYEQRGSFIIPSNAPSGRYTINLSLIDKPDRKVNWIRMGEEGRLLVHSRPLPTNGP